MADKISDFLISRLRDWNIHRIFGYPGDGINGILGALDRAEGDPEFIQVRHEEMAAFMACGHAKFSGDVGVCLATSGPGAIHLLNGLYDARMDHVPVLAIVGQQPRTAIGGSYQQEVDLQSLFKDVAREYVHTIFSPEQLPGAIDRAVRIAKTQRTVTCLIFPTDIQEEEAVENTPHKFKMFPGSVGYAQPRIIPSPESLQEAASILNSGERVAMLVGQGARNAAEEVLEVADRLGAGIAKALLGKDVIADTLPHITGSIGLLGTRASLNLMMECDTLLMIGSSFPYVQFLPEFDQARGIQIDIDGRMIGIRYPMALNLIGDAKDTLRELIPLINWKSDRRWREKVEKWTAEWWELVEAEAMNRAEPLNPQLVFWELSKQLPDECIIAADSGSGTNWYARDLKLREGMRASLSGNLATMGCGVPYAIGAKFAHPHKPVLALVGDGAMQMNGMNELLTIAKYWRRWADPRLVILVLHNNDLSQVTWEMRAMEGNPKYRASQDLPDFNYAAFADLVGLKGIRLDRQESISDAFNEAFYNDRPTVVDALTDPNVPPLPPHVTWEQATAMLSSLLKGDPDSGAVIKNSFKGVLTEFLPRSFLSKS